MFYVLLVLNVPISSLQDVLLGRLNFAATEARRESMLAVAAPIPV